MKKIILLLLIAIACNPTNKTKEQNIFMLNNEIRCEILHETDNYTRIITFQQVTDADQIKMIADSLKVKNEIVYFHIPVLLQRGDEYASITGNQVFIYNDFDKEKLLQKQMTNLKSKNNITELSEEDLAQKAFIISHDFVKKNLKSPKSADFPFNDYRYSKTESNTVIIESYVDAVNTYNAEIRTNYRIKLKFNGGDWADVNNWQALNLEFY